MKLVLDTCLKGFFIALVNEEKVVDKIVYEELKKKSDELPIAFKTLLERNNIKTKDINDFYVTQGPGSFMGVRAGLVFISTICAVLNKSMFVSDTLSFVKGKDDKEIYLDAKGGKSFALINGKLEIVDFKEDTKVDYEEISKNIMEHLKGFKKVNPLEDNTLYMKEPKIG